MATRKLEIEVIGDTKSLERALGRAGHASSKFGKIAKAGALAAGAGIAYGLGKVAKIGWDEFNQGQKVAAQTNAVLKSTSGVANVTSKHVERLGEALMKKSGIDDEVIKSGQNMLLTFTGIRNEVGKGNKIFDQATKLTLDLSVAMGKDMNSSAILVGKALNDPIAGLTSLSRVGVKFTQETKDQIKALVESGQTMKAQKIILAELRTEFGGSAKAAGQTFGGQINILRERFNNFAGDLVGKTIPVLQRFGQWLMPLLSRAGRFAGEVYRDIVGPAFVAIADAVRDNWPEIRRTAKTVFQALAAFWKVAGPVLKFWFTKVLPTAIRIYIKALAAIIAAVRSVVVATVRAGQAIIGAWNFVRDKTAVVFDFIRDRIHARVERVRQIFGNLRHTAAFTWEFIRDKAQIVVDKVGVIIGAFQKMIAKIQSIPKKIGGAFGWFIGKIGDIGGDVSAIDITAVRGAANRTVDSRLWGALGLARTMGMSLESGYRPGSTVRGSGSRSDHSYFPSKAIDISGTRSQMSSFARAVAGKQGIDTVIYSPLGIAVDGGSGFGGISSSATYADHFDHVHVDTFDRRGWHTLAQGLNVIGNYTGRPEPVFAAGRGGMGGGNTYVVNLSGHGFVGTRQELVRYLEAGLKEASRRGATAGWGG